MTRKHGNRKRPPWGDFLGGRPIELWEWRDEIPGGIGKGRFLVSVDTAGELRRRMERLKDHYAAKDWYELAVILASQRDVALTVVDQTSALEELKRPQWAGRDGEDLVWCVEVLRSQGFRTWQAICNELQDEHPKEFYQYMTAETLKARYHEAKRSALGRTKRKRE